MLTVLHGLADQRPFTALRTVLVCPFKATALREGPAVEPGTEAAWLMFLCSEHRGGLPGWPAVEIHADTSSVPRGRVLDCRPVEQLLQSHADLWLTPLTGVQPATSGVAWSDVLGQADRVLAARLEREAGG
ncbi:hypothetical protein [Streptomyces sp. NPDC087538]|uniref:hypothetical protein n=1 Tax=Streptomyces sp. NPDC087538 TaxID=3365797 RepID=UPI0038212A37